MNLQLSVSENACAGNMAQDFFRVANADSSPVALSDVTIKFWVEDTSGVPVTADVNYGGCVMGATGCEHTVTGVTASATSFGPSCGSDSTHQANWEITVTNTDPTPLPPGSTWDNVQIATHLATWAPFVPGTGSWYSPCGSGMPYAPATNYAVYVQGALVSTNGIAAPSCRAPHGSQQLSGYDVAPASAAPLVGPVPPSTVLDIDVGLPLRNRSDLQAFITDVSNPSSANYRQFKSLDDLTANYGPLPDDYSKLVAWAQGAGLTVRKTYSNNLLVTLQGTAAAIEQALYTNLVYRLRSDNTMFVSVDREPSLDLGPTVSHVGGIDDYMPVLVAALNGSAPNGNYWGNDYRNAYLQSGADTTCANLDGSGTTIAILAAADFKDQDLTMYNTAAQVPPFSAGQVQRVPVDDFSTAFDPGSEASLEATADIEIAHSMAPGATLKIIQQDKNLAAHWEAGLNEVATDDSIKVVSTSIAFRVDDVEVDAMNLALAHGVTFVSMSGDNGTDDRKSDSRTMFGMLDVGGTMLSTNSLGSTPYRAGETTWDDSDQASGGFVSDVLMPDYQSRVDMSLSKGSPFFRNIPDVSAVARDIGMFMSEDSPGTNCATTGCVFTGVRGTSAAAPIWAGFVALAQQLSNSTTGLTTGLGHLNPLIYAIGETRDLPASQNVYSTSFNDIKDNSTNAFDGNPGFAAVDGYDLATGWGTPTCELLKRVARQINPLQPDTGALVGPFSGPILNRTVTVTLDPSDPFVVTHFASVTNDSSTDNQPSFQGFTCNVSPTHPVDVATPIGQCVGEGTFFTASMTCTLQSDPNNPGGFTPTVQIELATGIFRDCTDRRPIDTHFSQRDETFLLDPGTRVDAFGLQYPVNASDDSGGSADGDLDINNAQSM